MRDVLRRPVVRLVVVLAGIALLLVLVYVLRDVLTPFAVAFTLAYFLNPVANGLERVFARELEGSSWIKSRVHPRTAAVAVLTLAVAIVFLLVVLFVVPQVYHQVTETVAKTPEYVGRLRERVEPLYERLNLRYPAQVEAARVRLAAALRQNLPDLLSPVTRAVAGAFTGVVAFLLALINLVIIPVFTVYLLYDMNHIKAATADLVPHRMRPYLYVRMRAVHELLSAFVRGQITVALILGAFYAVALSLCGVPMGLPVGFVIGFFNLIPFMSTVLGLPLALLLSWLDDQSLPRLAAVAAVFAFGQFVEGNFVTPRIVGRSLGLHAVVIMLAVLVGGKLFGFVGMVLAVPATAALSVFWADLRELYFRSEFYRGGGPPARAA